ncbi:MAG: DsrE family protein [Deltaproteobacteria bacterium]|nr:DsrE family protein [Deltaproteobacteria bacterium]
MKALLILNDAPYGSERTYNALRLADVMLTLEEELELSVFLVGDAVLCAKKGQTTPQGFYNIERMLKPVLRRGMVLVCTTCMDARGMKDEELAEGCRRAKLGELGTLTLDADKVLTF